jgi:PPIC-type PPIASE domain
VNPRFFLSSQAIMQPRPSFTACTFALALLSLAAQTLPAQVPTRADIDQSKAVELPKDPAAVIAIVGDSPILLGDLMPKVEARISEVLANSEQEVPEDQLHFARINLLRPILAQSIQNKMMRESFLIDQVGTESAEKRREADEKLTSRARQMFFESELPELKKQYNVENTRELDEMLRAKGSSLSARQRDFIDAMLGHLYIRAKVEKDPNVSIAEINEHYQVNLKQFERPSRARWEQLSVMFSRYASKEEAYNAIADMGREALFGGNVQAVAKAKSQEPFAGVGGLHDWTAEGSLASDAINQQVFSIPLNKLSEIIEDSEGLHIIRVLEREQAGVTPAPKFANKKLLKHKSR